MSWGQQMQEQYELLYALMADMVSRGELTRVNDGSKMQELQLTVLDGETIDGAERFQNYGFSSHPQAGSEALAVFVGGVRSHPVIVAVDDRRVRVGSLKPGEVVIYTDEGDTITLKRENNIEIKTKHLTINAEEDVTINTKAYAVNTESYTVTASEGVTYITPVYNLGGEGGCATSIRASMDITGNIDQKGDITQQGSHSSSGDQVAGGISQMRHTHTGVMPGGGNTGAPQ